MLACGGSADRGDTGDGAPAAAAAPAAPQETEVEFRARVGDLMMQSEPIQAGKSLDDTVSVRLPATVYDPPQTVPPTTKDQADRSSVLGAVASFLAAFQANDADWIRANFASADQQDIGRLLADSSMRERQATYFAGIARAHLHAVITVPGEPTYKLAMITYDDEPLSRVNAVTYVLEGGDWKQTNALSADSRLDVVWAAFRHGGVGR